MELLPSARKIEKLPLKRHHLHGGRAAYAQTPSAQHAAIIWIWIYDRNRRANGQQRLIARFCRSKQKALRVPRT